MQLASSTRELCSNSMETSARRDTRVPAGQWLGRHATDASLPGLRNIAMIHEDGKVAAAAARTVAAIRERESWQD